MITQVFSTVLHQLGHGAEFGTYFGGLQRGNCTGCPDCHCGEGPSREEARRDFRAMLTSKMGFPH